MKKLIRHLLLTAAALVVPLVQAAPSASDFPSKPVKIIVPAPPGGGIDVFTRVIAAELSKRWGQAVIVDNRAGAGGAIAASAVLQSPADGYTLFALTDAVLVANRFSYRSLNYDPDKSFTPISLMAQSDQIIVTNQASPAHTLREFIDLSKKSQKGLVYGQWGVGSSPQLVFEMLNKLADTRLISVPYKGVAPVMQALLADEVQVSVMSAVTGAALLQTGKLRPLAIASNERSPLYPAVPTTAEVGLPQLKAFIWFGMVGPAGMPKALADKIGNDLRAVINDPTLTQRQPSIKGWTLIASTPEAMSAAVAQQVPVIAEMMKSAGVEAQ